MSAEILAVLMRMEAKIDALAARPAARASGKPGEPPTLLPNYGKAKGQPIAGATEKDLRFYEGRCLQSIGDPSKAQWRAKEESMLAALRAELKRQGFPVEGGDTRPDGNDGVPDDESLPF